MRKSATIVLLLFIPVLAAAVHISANLKTDRHDLIIKVVDPKVPPIELSVAVVGDIHLPVGSSSINGFHDLLLEVKSSKPDLVAFVGDYTRNLGGEKFDSHRRNIVMAMKAVDPIPRVVVFGNYETWSGLDAWRGAFAGLNVRVMENEVALIQTPKGPICVRGLGDSFSGRFSYVDYQSECQSLPKVTITHDPAGAFDFRVKGLVIAGHTHCGQVDLPLIGPLWVPTDAPGAAHCGLYRDPFRTVFVTSGVGTAILPLRIGTKSNWDFLTIQIVGEQQT